MNMNELLNLRCRESNELIEVGEVVAVFDHGDYANDVAVYGHFEWNGYLRCFQFVVCRDLDVLLPKELQGVELDENFDPFYSGVRKLTPYEHNEMVS